MTFGRRGQPKIFLEEDALYEYALGALGRRMLSEAELVRRLRARMEPGDAGEAALGSVVARLKEYGFLNDRAFADNYVQLRQQNEKHGARRVKQDLGLKGVSKAVIEETVEARYAEVSEEQLAREHLERKRVKQPTNEKEAARVMRRLVGAGFSIRVVYKVLRAWKLPDESLGALELMEESASEAETADGSAGEGPYPEE